MHALNQFVDNQFTTVRHKGSIVSQLNGLYTTENALDTQLTNFDAAYYTAERLAGMTMNDKIFATRIHQELDGGDGLGTPPVANFSFSATLLAVDFTDSSTSPNGLPITEWDWDFGDGAGLSTDQNPTHTYAGAGTYNVLLTVFNAAGHAGVRQHAVTVTDV